MAIPITSTAITPVKGTNPVSSFSAVSYDWDSTSLSYTYITEGRAKILLKKDPNKTDSPVLCTNGNFIVRGELAGTGSILTGGDLSFEGKSQLQSNPGSGLGIYAKGTINLNKITAKDDLDDPSPNLRSAFDSFVNRHDSNYLNCFSDGRYFGK